ncbi:hypothetical protein Dsin_008876 [Dipteronia sinensis]|uniref:Reverse transcriptase zinc-binding domain-containing protein n=1 Tax=Dipteronia sinensis TaxID=43782 RepID=A0AAE0API7_9ROSI|nr:hypothetical protein Dsin_008876 [Dipteronia sinensis]
MVDCHEKYPGLPTYVGRNKRSLFVDIIDRVWNHMKGCHDKFLSMGGKEVLIKAVVQYIPIYSMSLFKLPKCHIKEIAMFWWRGNPDKSKIHWSKWSRICKPKVFDGLRSRDLVIFNKALLAKQCWRLVKFSDSLPAKVLRAYYYHNLNFFEAEEKPFGSLYGKACYRVGKS